MMTVSQSLARSLFDYCLIAEKKAKSVIVAKAAILNHETKTMTTETPK